MIITLLIVAVLAIAIWLYMLQPQFGAVPKGKRLEKISHSPNFGKGKFKNRVEKPVISKGYSVWREALSTLFKKYPRRRPVGEIPSVKTDLKSLPTDSNVLIWFGHSSFYLQVDGVKILVDPVFSGNASPLPGAVKAYKGTDVYSVDDMPEIDYMLISHDHYDHVDYKTALGLKDKVKHVVGGLGIGAHYERWGYTPDQIIEKDWGEKVEVNAAFTIYVEETHHNCGRGFIRDKALWASYVIQSPSQKIYYSGDGGHDDRFKKIASKYGNIDWAVMECGQYDKAWQSVHQLPEEVDKATTDIKAKNLLIVHHSKFTLAKHPWDEPLEKITSLSTAKSYRFVTPMIGETVWLEKPDQLFQRWWKTVR